MKSFRKRSVFSSLSRRALAAIALAVSVLVTASSLTAQSGSANEHWVGTWATADVLRPSQPPAQATPAPAPAPAPAPQAAATPAPAAAPGGGRGGPPPVSNFNNQTLRQIVHTSIGGSRVRVVLSNAFGTAPLPLGAAHLALRDKDAAIVASVGSRADVQRQHDDDDSRRRRGVERSRSTSPCRRSRDLAVDLYLPGNTAATRRRSPSHNGAFQTNYVSTTGNHVGEDRRCR